MAGKFKASVVLDIVEVGEQGEELPFMDGNLNFHRLDEVGVLVIEDAVVNGMIGRLTQAGVDRAIAAGHSEKLKAVGLVA